MPKPLQPVSLFGLAAQGETGSLALKSSASGFFGRLGIAGNFCPPPAVGISGVGRGAQRKALFCLTGPPTPTLRLASAFILCIASCFQTLLQVLRRAVAPSGRHVWQSGREEDDESAAGRSRGEEQQQQQSVRCSLRGPSVPCFGLGTFVGWAVLVLLLRPPARPPDSEEARLREQQQPRSSLAAAGSACQTGLLRSQML